MFFFVGFFGFFLFLIFYENNTNFSLSTRFFMNNQKGGGDTLACGWGVGGVPVQGLALCSLYTLWKNYTSILIAVLIAQGRVSRGCKA